MVAEALRVLRPGGRLAVSDVVLSRPIPAELQAVTALWTGCVSGALTEQECTAGLVAAGFEDVSIEVTRVYDRVTLEGLASAVPEEIALTQLEGVIRSAFIRARKPD